MPNIAVLAAEVSPVRHLRTTAERPAQYLVFRAAYWRHSLPGSTDFNSVNVLSTPACLYCSCYPPHASSTGWQHCVQGPAGHVHFKADMRAYLNVTT